MIRVDRPDIDVLRAHQKLFLAVLTVDLKFLAKRPPNPPRGPKRFLGAIAARTGHSRADKGGYFAEPDRATGLGVIQDFLDRFGRDPRALDLLLLPGYRCPLLPGRKVREFENFVQ
jgi:hypothetical protein